MFFCARSVIIDRHGALEIVNIIIIAWQQEAVGILGFCSGYRNDIIDFIDVKFALGLRPFFHKTLEITEYTVLTHISVSVKPKLKCFDPDENLTSIKAHGVSLSVGYVSYTRSHYYYFLLSLSNRSYFSNRNILYSSSSLGSVSEGKS